MPVTMKGGSMHFVSVWPIPPRPGKQDGGPSAPNLSRISRTGTVPLEFKRQLLFGGFWRKDEMMFSACWRKLTKSSKFHFSCNIWVKEVKLCTIGTSQSPMPFPLFTGCTWWKVPFQMAQSVESGDPSPGPPQCCFYLLGYLSYICEYSGYHP